MSVFEVFGVQIENCPTWTRTRRLLLQRQTCYQLHHRAIKDMFPMKFYELRLY